MLQLRKGDCYAQNFKNKRTSFKSSLPKQISFRLSIIFLLLNFLLFRMPLAQAQDQHSLVGSEPLDVKPLRIGDSIPEELWNLPLNVLNHEDGKSVIKLDDYRDRSLILLDFWNNVCVPCLKLIPKIEGIAHEVGSDFQPIPITNQKREKIETFLEGKDLDFLTVVEGSILTKYFPMFSVPHEIWIKDGKVFAITGGNAINKNTVAGVMSGAIKKLPEKLYNTSYDNTIPLLVDGNGGNSPDLLYHSTLTGYLPGVVANIQGELEGDRYFIRHINLSPVELFKNVARRFNYELVLNSRTVFADENVKKLINLNPDDSTDQSHLYSYELVVPRYMKEDINTMAMEELNRFFSKRYAFSATIARRGVPCWIITVADSSQLPFSSEEANIREQNDVLRYSNQMLRPFVEAMNFNFHTGTPYIIDNTGIGAGLNLRLFLGDHGFAKTKTYLESVGFSLSLETRVIEALEFQPNIKPVTN